MRSIKFAGTGFDISLFKYLKNLNPGLIINATPQATIHGK